MIFVHSLLPFCTAFVPADVKRIRTERAAARADDALLPLGNSDDYAAPIQTLDPLAAARTAGDAFGVVQTSALGAKFDLR